MTLKRPQAKGKRFEYFVRNALRQYGFQAQRTPLSGAFDDLPGDIMSSGFPFFIEAKNTEKSEFVPWYHKADDEAGGKPALIVWTRNNEPAYAFLLFTDLLDILTGKPVKRMKIEKPQRNKKQGIEDTAGLMFSKKKQLEKHDK